MVVATVAAAISIAACGGGSDQGSALSASYVKAANQLCDGWTKALEEIGPNPPLADLVATERFTKRVLAVDEDYTARFVALQSSPQEKTILAPVHDGFQSINEAERAVISSAQRGDRAGVQSYQQHVIDETFRTYDRLRKLRLTVCSG